MKALIIINDATNNCEQAILSRDLSADELGYIYRLVGHGNGRTVHYVDCSGPIPFDDIAEALNEFLIKIAEG